MNAQHTPGPDGQYPPAGSYAPQGPGSYQSPGQPGPGFPTGPPAQGGPPQPEPTKRSWFARHKVLTVLGALVALIIVFSALSSGGSDEPEADPAPSTAATPADTGDEPANEADAEPADEAAEQTPGIGDPARDGTFEFVITEVETGVAQVGDEFLSEEAQGQFVLVHLSVTNIGDQAEYFFDSDQTLIDTEDRQHSADSEAGIYLGDNETFLSEINPGNTLEGIIVFDVPADATPAGIELHDSAFSGGVSVTLE
ncbi:DUF4352 domain-containing protein [Ruania alba]|uniref:DUF4352 domain-containing protein n=1 Tax=Ruania alba TaxID=648782 RepID=A0A1H5N3Q4_9MICO|nr:DUF4352 domain-containing protein [Ruania alba]SEE95511.1 protein of unknown function [Ruania alba]